MEQPNSLVENKSDYSSSYHSSSSSSQSIPSYHSGKGFFEGKHYAAVDDDVKIDITAMTRNDSKESSSEEDLTFEQQLQRLDMENSLVIADKLKRLEEQLFSGDAKPTSSGLAEEYHYRDGISPNLYNEVNVAEWKDHFLYLCVQGENICKVRPAVEEAVVSYPRAPQQSDSEVTSEEGNLCVVGKSMKIHAGSYPHEEVFAMHGELEEDIAVDYEGTVDATADDKQWLLSELRQDIVSSLCDKVWLAAMDDSINQFLKNLLLARRHVQNAKK